MADGRRTLLGVCDLEIGQCCRGQRREAEVLRRPPHAGDRRRRHVNHVGRTKEAHLVEGQRVVVAHVARHDHGPRCTKPPRGLGQRLPGGGPAHADHLHAGAGRIAERADEVEDGRPTERSTKRSDLRHRGMVDRRQAEAEPEFREAPPAHPWRRVDLHAEPFEHVGGARAAGDGAVAVLGHRLPCCGDDNARRGRDVEGARTVAPGAAGVGHDSAVPRHRQHPQPKGRGDAGNVRSRLPPFGECHEPFAERVEIHSTGEHRVDEVADVVLRRTFSGPEPGRPCREIEGIRSAGSSICRCHGERAWKGRVVPEEAVLDTIDIAGFFSGRVVRVPHDHPGASLQCPLPRPAK